MEAQPKKTNFTKGEITANNSYQIQSGKEAAGTGNRCAKNWARGRGGKTVTGTIKG